MSFLNRKWWLKQVQYLIALHQPTAAAFRPFFFLLLLWHSKKCFYIGSSYAYRHVVPATRNGLGYTLFCPLLSCLSLTFLLSCNFFFFAFYSNLKMSSYWPSKLISRFLGCSLKSSDPEGGLSESIGRLRPLFLLVIWQTTLLRPESMHRSTLK